MKMRNTAKLFLMLLCTSHSPPVSADPSVVFFSASERYKAEATAAGLTIAKSSYCQPGKEIGVFLWTATELASNIKKPLSALQTNFKDKLPEVVPTSRLYVASCKAPSGNVDNLWLRGVDIGHPERVFRQNRG